MLSTQADTGSQKNTILSKTSIPETDVIINDSGACGVLVLNRPKALNALNLSMVQKIYPILKQWEQTKKLIIIRGTGDKAFCAGGDVKSLVLALSQPNGDQLGKDFFKAEYTLNHLIGTYKKPYIALINGITMGGGVGLSVHGKYRIATDKTLFAMPETAIGLFPDVGGSYFLSRLKGKFGLFLGLTGYRLKGVDVLHVGVATHFVPSNKLESVYNELLLQDSDIDKVLEQYLPKNIKQEFSLNPYTEIINECFSAPTVEEIINRLEANKSEWVQNIIKMLNKMSPTALKVTKKAIDEGSKKSLAECLIMEYRLVCACLKKNSDFAEGVRALLIDKDQNPLWNPTTLEQVSDDIVEKRFTPLLQNDLKLSKL
ncbi:PREDICTED: 3-hydroxyisobutyryl-CoA hydrolase, mitochondrial [Ceratosolen solmsi marchali]|uniref:3-hydroxyisobutyryl-CoA hydrolase, mitochondrial n=1 Tax=Ceratosolen solmsi marchali TaxID=326594 RepID=A0AAJ6YGG9_9HYME|nr:PREDICTED: 3-hydroxyisobutyryl-CoA hydrolase, mitochondrial [Ceratosolen solmsi marchali]